MDIAFLGPVGTFSEQAAKRFEHALGTDNGRLVPCKTIRDAANAASSDASFAVLPYYNLLDGAVTDTADALAAGQLRAVALVRLPIRFDAASQAPLEGIQTVASHPKALAQCASYIAGLGDHVSTKAVDSTAAGVELAKGDPQVLALASSGAISASGLPLLASDVGDKRYGIANYTEFVAVGCTGMEEPASLDEVDQIILQITIGESMRLSSVLAAIESGGYTLRKVMSRPAVTHSNASGMAAPQVLSIECGCTAMSRSAARGAVEGLIASSGGGAIHHVGSLAEIDATQSDQS